jgi:hypothetical protein
MNPSRSRRSGGEPSTRNTMSAKGLAVGGDMVSAEFAADRRLRVA